MKISKNLTSLYDVTLHFLSIGGIFRSISSKLTKADEEQDFQKISKSLHMTCAVSFQIFFQK